MTETLLLILAEGLKAWNNHEGQSHYKAYMKNKKAHDEELDKRSKGNSYSQLRLDRCLRNIDNISKAYYQYIITKKD